jgi:hypothetical protein
MNMKDYTDTNIPFAGYKVYAQVLNNACKAISDVISEEQTDFLKWVVLYGKCFLLTSLLQMKDTLPSGSCGSLTIRSKQ